MKELAKKYKHFPGKMILANVIMVLHTQLPIFFISKMFGSELLGFYFFAHRLIFMPVGLIGTSIGNVFRQRATKDYHAVGRFDALYLKITKKLFFISFLPAIFLYFIVPDIFTLVLGEKWRVAGEYARILVVMGFASFLSTPTNLTAQITERTGYILFWHISRLISNIMICLAVFYMHWAIHYYLLIFVTNSVLHYFIDIVIKYKFSQGRAVRNE